MATIKEQREARETNYGKLLLRLEGRKNGYEISMCLVGQQMKLPSGEQVLLMTLVNRDDPAPFELYARPVNAVDGQPIADFMNRTVLGYGFVLESIIGAAIVGWVSKEHLEDVEEQL